MVFPILIEWTEIGALLRQGTAPGVLLNAGGEPSFPHLIMEEVNPFCIANLCDRCPNITD